jgi:hypothetical protein
VAEIKTMHEVAMSDMKSDLLERSRLREIALSRWENEGGARADRLQALSAVSTLTNAELVQRQVRVIAEPRDHAAG